MHLKYIKYIKLVILKCKNTFHTFYSLYFFDPIPPLGNTFLKFLTCPSPKPEGEGGEGACHES